MRRLAVIAAVFGSLALPATAPARHHIGRARISRQNPTQAALKLAYRYWHTAPCDGHVTLTMALPPADDENAGAWAAMWSSWQGADGGEENEETAKQPFTHCTVGINSAVWTTEEYAAFTAWPEFSVRLIHEVGHLLGHGHSADAASIMYPEPSARIALTGDTAPGW